MSSYLYSKFKGQYRVLANVDRNTNDFPRDENGVVESSFDDYFIPSKTYKLEVRHGVRNNLTCYYFSTGQIFNILYKMCEELCNKQYERTTQNNERVLKCLLNNLIITEYEQLDGEGYFCFKTEKMPIIAPYLNLKTIGANISPLSVKNLPKNDYKLSSEEEEDYKEIIHKKELEMYELGKLIKIANKTFEETLLKKQVKEMKELGMTHKQYASANKLWDVYLSIVEKAIDNYKK